MSCVWFARWARKSSSAVISQLFFFWRSNCSSLHGRAEKAWFMTQNNSICRVIWDNEEPSCVCLAIRIKEQFLSHKRSRWHTYDTWVFSSEISGKEKEKTRKTRRKEEIWGTDAKRVNCSTLPCSYDNTHKESTWLECLEKRVDISEILAWSLQKSGG